MSNSFFRFKQFIICQDRCAMKVGTDGVLLGAWADRGFLDAQSRFGWGIKGTDVSAIDADAPFSALNAGAGFSVLDVGTGTGLIALMIAQRNSLAVIDAVEIDPEACIQAVENVNNSLYKDRIRVLKQSFFDFTSEKKYDLILSNPPFFKNSLHCTDKKRNIARHNVSLPLSQLIDRAIPLLSENGCIALILPVLLSDELDLIIATRRLFVRRRTDVITVEGGQPKRFLVEITVRNPQTRNDKEEDSLVGLEIAPMSLNKTQEHSTIVLETKEHQKTAQYSRLTKAFYL